MKLNKLIILSTLSFVFQISYAQNWTQFRGSNLDGKALEAIAPTHWSPDSNIVWKTAIEGKGWSSPVVYDDQIWLTSEQNDGQELYANCISKKDGSSLFNLLVFEPANVLGKHAVNTYATPTPCIEEGRVYVNFGSYGTACIETDSGKTIWSRTDLICDHVQGPGSSPILYKNKLILHFEGIDSLFIVALDKKTGETIWKTNRPKELYERLEPIGRKAYITPIVINVNGKELLISNGSAVCMAYDVETGVEIWRVLQGEDSTISMPIYENGTVYFYTSFVTPAEGDKYCELLAVDPNGVGNLTELNVKWRLTSPILQLLTPIIHDGIIYTIDTKSNLMIVDALNGEILDQRRVKGKYNASPVMANGLIYFPSSTGQTLIIHEGRTINILAENKLQGQIWATPAIVGHQLLIRSSDFLYLIGE
ncbi:MAG: PQQ-binding-like beta-propeller repeat protein [Prolixibacteraceae bacterium]